MKVLNCFIYKDEKDQVIKIRLDLINRRVSKISDQINIKHMAKRHMGFLKWDDQKKLETILSRRTAEEEREFMGTNRVFSTTITADSKIFSFPGKPVLALEFLLGMDLVLNGLEASIICFQKPLVEDFLTDTISSVSLDEYVRDIDNWKESALLKLQEALLAACREEASYKPVMEMLSRANRLYGEGLKMEKPQTFLHCLDSNRDAILYSGFTDLGNLLLKPEMAPSIKIQGLLNCARAHIHQNMAQQFSEMIAAINQMAIKNLFAPCIGKVALDGGTYKWSYTEYTLLKHAIFAIRPDGKVSISSLNANEGYQKFYAAGKQNHDILKDEMIFLGTLLGLEFEANCNFHQEMVFTMDSSKKLITQGLHFNVDYVKNMLRFQNDYRFFVRSMPLPTDICKTIAWWASSMSMDAAEENAAVKTLWNMTDPENSFQPL